MSKSKPPAFQLYAGDLLTDVMDWTDEELGAHMRLLCWSWVNRRGIPRDFPRMNRIAPSAEKCWSTIGPKWKEGPDSTFVNDRLEATRTESDAFRERQKAKSGLAAEARKTRESRVGRKKRSTGSSNDISTDIPKDTPVGIPTGYPLEGEGGVIRVEVSQGKERAKINPNIPKTDAERALSAAASDHPYSSEAFRLAWYHFDEMRKKIRKPMTPAARQMLLNKLARWGEDRAIEALNKSVVNCWQDVFEPKTPSASGAAAARQATEAPQHQPVTLGQAGRDRMAKTDQRA